MTTTANLTEIAAAEGYTALALALNLAMDGDAGAQDRYAAIYGEPWAPLPMPGSEDHAIATEHRAIGTDLNPAHRSSTTAATRR